MRGLAALLLAMLVWPAWGHDLGVARVTLIEQPDYAWLVEVKLPENIEARSPIFPQHCRMEKQSSRTLPAKNRQDLWQFQCTTLLGSEDAIVFPWQREGAFVTTQRLNGRDSAGFFKSSDDRIQVVVGQTGGETRSTGTVARHYTGLGVEHILMGWDHLAFVLALCLIATGWPLLKLVTAFTVGHSLTLALAVLGWVSVPVPPVEACIALSIAFVARAALRPNSALRHGTGLVFAFGLLHGLGFASALSENGIEQGELLPGLLSFNVGVELGQLVFVLLVLSVITLTKNILMPARTRPAIAFGLGTLGLFWTIERVAGFWV